MSNNHSGNTQPSIDQEEHSHISGVPGKKVFNIDSSGNVVDFTDVNYVAAGSSDPHLEIPRGNISGQISIDKYGRSTNVDSGVATDVWDGANATDDIDIWVAPTQARVHSIVSTSDADSDTGGAIAQGDGARTVKIFGLTSWDADGETSETVVMDGTDGTDTANPYVIIYRIRVETFGSSGPNVGQIEAVAATDNTETAIVLAGEGQTQMAIFAIPSAQTLYMTNIYGSILRSNLGTTVCHADFQLLYNPDPEADLDSFLVKHTVGLGSRANSPFDHTFRPYKRFDGPGIMKIQVTGSANNLDVSAGFDAIILDN